MSDNDFNSPNRPFESDSTIEVARLRVDELQTEITERGGSVREEGRNLRKNELRERLVSILQRRKEAEANHRRRDDNAQGRMMMPSSSSTTRDSTVDNTNTSVNTNASGSTVESLREQLRVQQEKAQEMAAKLKELEDKGKLQTTESSRASLMEELEQEYSGVRSRRQIVLTEETVENVVSQEQLAVTWLSRGKSVNFLNSKSGRKWIARIHEFISASEPSTIPAQFAKALANWDIRLVDWAWFLDEVTQEEYDRQASSVSFLDSKAEKSILRSMIKEKMVDVSDPLFSEMEARREGMPRFMEWERYVRRFGIPMVKKYLDRAVGVGISRKLEDITLEIERWIRRDRIPWRIIWEAYQTEMNILQKEVNRGLCTSTAVAVVVYKEVDLKKNIFDRMVVKARFGSMQTNQPSPKRIKSENWDKLEKQARDMLCEKYKRSPHWKGTLDFTFFGSLPHHRDDKGNKLCYLGCAERWLAQQDRKFANLKLCKRGAGCRFSHKWEEAWKTDACMVGTCNCSTQLPPGQPSGSNRRWREE